MIAPLARIGLTSLALLMGLASAQNPAPSPYAQRFEAAWRLVEERYWDRDYNGTDWNAVRTEYEPRALDAADDDDFYTLLDDMYQEIGDDHSRYLSPDRVASFRAEYGDLPCLGVFSYAAGRETLGRVGFELLEGRVGYVQLGDLIGTAQDLRTAVVRLEPQAESFIVDLRGNPGGRLIEMMQAAGVFTGGFLWRVVTRWSLPLPYPAIGPAVTDKPLVVLIDGNVNSAGEGLAGALQAGGRATLVGETTAGNVEAILPFCLRDGSQAFVATGVLAPIGGPTWNGRGVEPDIAVAAEDALAAALAHLLDNE